MECVGFKCDTESFHEAQKVVADRAIIEGKFETLKSIAGWMLYQSSPQGRFSYARWLALDVPTIGITKKLLCGVVKKPTKVGDCNPSYWMTNM